MAEPNVVVHHVDVPDDPLPIEAWTDDEIAARYDVPARGALRALQEGRADGVRRVVFVLPATVGPASETVRILALSAARQWADEGVTVNCIVGDAAPAVVEFLSSGAVTGKTL
ncbi:MAG TPA: hypothetical protein VHC63_04945 [Acidimicrobiales bacterium]|nr:hypothetical protein [Acidimicrobiales bacterium]